MVLSGLHLRCKNHRDPEEQDISRPISVLKKSAACEALPRFNSPFHDFFWSFEAILASYGGHLACTSLPWFLPCFRIAKATLIFWMVEYPSMVPIIDSPRFWDRFWRVIRIPRPLESSPKGSTTKPQVIGCSDPCPPSTKGLTQKNWKENQRIERENFWRSNSLRCFQHRLRSSPAWDPASVSPCVAVDVSWAASLPDWCHFSLGCNLRRELGVTMVSWVYLCWWQVIIQLLLSLVVVGYYHPSLSITSLQIEDQESSLTLVISWLLSVVTEEPVVKIIGSCSAAVTSLLQQGEVLSAFSVHFPSRESQFLQARYTDWLLMRPMMATLWWSNIA